MYVYILCILYMYTYVCIHIMYTYICIHMYVYIREKILCLSIFVWITIENFLARENTIIFFHNNGIRHKTKRDLLV
jgi:hypothetical protein